MTRKISIVYDETINAIKSLKPDMGLEEENKILEVLKNNKDYFGLTMNPYVMTYDELKRIPIWIMDHLEMYKRGHNLVTFTLMKEKIAEEPDFLKQFDLK
ncbi:MAG: hypothetical protein KO253_04010 [Methanobrevibacter arboriphilus]|nr:hypothetical protein [Methanobrevibacter arboriphilus]